MPVLIKVSQNQIKEAKSFGKFYATWGLAPAITDESKRDFDELLLEQHGSVCWLHFAVRPKDNRRRIALIKA